MTTTGSTGTERKSRGTRITLDDWLDYGFNWISENALPTLLVLGALIVVGAIATGISEWNRSRQTSAQAALAAVDRELDKTLGGGADVANPDTARGLREKALAGYEAVSKEHEGTFGASMAVIRAATLEIDLERFDAAEKRLAANMNLFAANSPERAVALRLHGYALERLEKLPEAAAAYEQSAAIASYPGRAGSSVQAGDTFARLGQKDKAVSAYEALSYMDPTFAERSGVLDRLEELRAGAPAAGGAAGSDPAAPAKP